MPIRLIISDEPPSLTNGSGMPLVGSSPSTTLMLTNAWMATIVVSAEREERAEGIGRLQRDAQAAPGDDAEADQQAARADEAELLGDHRVDEVGVRLGQIEELLDAVHQAAAGDAAGADRDERLDDLKAARRAGRPRD